MTSRSVLIALSLVMWSTCEIIAQVDSTADGDALPKVPPGFEVKLFAKEPLVRQPCSMAFDARGRLFVGMGPQYRHPKPDTPGDSVVIVEDSNGDGVADKVRVFATGFNCIQGLAWHGRDLWVANSPDLTVVRDLDGDDEADEYVRIYTDLGNLEHGIHGLNWAPDGKLYMSKGNSKGLTQPGRIAPRPFRELWGVKAPGDSPDFPAPITYRKGEYRHAYHNPADDWGREGGVLRCDDLGKNLEIVSRGMRNPWDVTIDDGFNLLGTDNDQNEGDRVFMPFWNAHFGWNHSWSPHWTDRPHSTCAPVSGPIFHGSGTGIIYLDTPQFPPEYRRVFLVNDWLRKTTFVWKPVWEGALLRPEGGTWTPLVEAGKSLFRPTDIEVGPDGNIWILGWSRYYGVEYRNGEMINEGRIFHVRSNNPAPATKKKVPAKRSQPLEKWSVQELIEDFDGPLPVWRIDAADELVRRGEKVKSELFTLLKPSKLSVFQETWTSWTLGRMLANDSSIEDFFAAQLEPDSTASFNLRLQAIRILAHRIRQFGVAKSLPSQVRKLLQSDEPRIRFACVDAIAQTKQVTLLPDLLNLLATETDRVVYYSAWHALRELVPTERLVHQLKDSRGRVRKAALLALLETHAIKNDIVIDLMNDPDLEVREIATLRLNPVAKSAKDSSSLENPFTAGPSLISNIKTRSTNEYRSIPGGAVPGAKVFTDREYTIKSLPKSLHGAELLQTSNNDDGSKGPKFLILDAMVPLRIHVGLDTRQKNPPKWLLEGYRPSDSTAEADHWSLQLYSRDVPAGRIELGGNTDDGIPGNKSNYILFFEPLPLPSLEHPTDIIQAQKLLSQGNSAQGELLFKQVAGCSKCHSLTQQKNSFGPQLSDIGARAEPGHILQSILNPDAHITEGFTQLVIETKDGKVHAGVLMEESDLNLTLGLPTAERLVIGKKNIESRTTTKKSAMPSFDRLLKPGQVADITAFLMTQKAKPAELQKKRPPESSTDLVKTSVTKDSPFGLELTKDKLTIKHGMSPLGAFVFGDQKIFRPFLSNLHGLNGTKLTRNHPPIPGTDATDHETMHPGIWLGFGDISGIDFWRNRGRIKHLRFLEPPTATNDQVTFATESELVAPSDMRMGTMVNRIRLNKRPKGLLIVWEAIFHATEQELHFGDQEEMGLGARVASEFTEKKGGKLLNSNGLTTAKLTWGQSASWCDYSGTKNGTEAGITLMASPSNFRLPWWHNRDYGVFVANPFGRSAMRQGSKSVITVKKGDSLRLLFGAMLHDSAQYDPASEYRHFLKTTEEKASTRK